jgi:hypothetical protein
VIFRSVVPTFILEKSVNLGLARWQVGPGGLFRYEKLMTKYLKGQEADLKRIRRLVNLLTQLCDR